MKNRLLVALAALMLALGLASPSVADTGNSQDGSCTDSTYTGTVYNGSWSRAFNPGCNNNTVASVTVSWHNYTTSSGLHHIVWSGTIQTWGIAGTKCVQVALDWFNPSGGHSDAQIIRNCRENTTYHPGVMPQDINSDPITSGAAWYVRRLQISVYSPDTNSVDHVVCPGNSAAPADTDTDGECTGWLSKGAAPFNSVGAKVYLKDNDGSEQNNSPTYPEAYNIYYQTDPNH